MLRIATENLKIMETTLVRLVISQSELFSTWPADTVSRLVKAAHLTTVEADTVLLRTGDTAQFLHILATGSIRLVRGTPSGRNFTAGLHLPGDYHGLGPAITQVPYFYTAVCKEKSVLVKIPAPLLREVLREDGHLAFTLFAALGQRHRRALDHFESAATHPTKARVAQLLRAIHARSKRGGEPAEISLSQDEIATMLGTRRQVVNKVLGIMAEEGILEIRYGKIAITDLAKLQKMVGEPSVPSIL